MFVNGLMKLFATCMGVVAILLLNIMKVFSWVEVLSWIDHVWSSEECACYTCDSSVHLSVIFICFVYVLVCRKLSPYLRV